MTKSPVKIAAKRNELGLLVLTRDGQRIGTADYCRHPTRVGGIMGSRVVCWFRLDGNPAEFRLPYVNMQDMRRHIDWHVQQVEQG